MSLSLLRRSTVLGYAAQERPELGRRYLEELTYDLVELDRVVALY